jgi:hypothetical protein
MPHFNITLLTSSRYLSATPGDEFAEVILLEDKLLTGAIEKRGLNVTRTNWDNPDFNWADTDFVLFRTPWDYFSRYDEFSLWLEKAATVTKFINSIDTIKWNIDKHYMLELQHSGINIPPTIFIEPGDNRTLSGLAATAGWKEFILKPAVSGGAWHTYRLNKGNIPGHEAIFSELVKDKSMLLQEYQQNINGLGEISLMLFGGKFSHAVLKKAKQGDFRVQDSFGGSVHDYTPSPEEIAFAELVVNSSLPGIPYARVDVMRDNTGALALMELELFEPALWLRKHPPAAELFADILAVIAKNR